MKPRSVFFAILLTLALAIPFLSACGDDDDGINARANRVVSADWVKEVLVDGDNNGKPYVIAETNWGPAAKGYLDGHVPGAVYVNTDEIEYDYFYARNDTPEVLLGRSTTEAEDLAKGLGPDDTLPRNFWNFYPEAYLLPAIAYMGIDVDTTVVVYAPDVSAAARLVLALMFAGVADVRLLDGGYDAWLSAGYDDEAGLVGRVPVDDFGRTTALHPEYIVDTAWVQQVVADPASVSPAAVIADIRSRDEYIGASAPYGYIPADGRIAGALWGRAGDGPWDMDDYVRTDGTLRTLEEVKDFWAAEGITANRTVSFYCGTGWRAALSWHYAYRMGWDHISLYDGGWYEWTEGPDAATNPVEDDEPGLP